MICEKKARAFVPFYETFKKNRKTHQKQDGKTENMRLVRALKSEESMI